jgi:arginyl-tRNA synthetase|tara:strand:- start:9954 stop:11696 length:1743 start_codon:yes stop_codon:yes gene_type:complete
LIEIINKKIELFITSIESIDKDSVRIILNKSSTSISDDLDKGHVTTNVCMVAASILKLNPRELSEKLKNTLDELNIFKNIQIAGPGFINITLHKKEFASVLHNIIKERDSFGESNIGDGKKVQIEFVSANPTGPLHVGHGRGAAYGDAIGRILKATGSTVEKEYYINDAGRQIDILTASVILRAVQKKLSNFFPQNGYKGNYIDSISEEFTSNNKIKYDDVESIIKDLPSDPEEEIDSIIIKLKNLDDLIWNSVKSFSLDSIIESIKNDLEDFNVSFDSWFNESSLGTLNDDSSEISKSITKLKKDGKAYEKDGAIWLNTENSGDDKHRVLIRDDGRATYFASDIAYHKNKIDRGYDNLINIWGADHHGYIKRIEASIDALGSKKEKLTVKLVQFANLFKNGESIKMSTRSGEFFTLRELLEDIGADAARFYYLSKQADQHLDFDINLAKSDSKENIFYYIQYAHARIFSLEQKYVEMYPGLGTSIEAIEKDLYDKCDPLIHEISKYPKIVNKSARMLQPHIIIFYLKDLSQLFHSYYNDNHVLSESKENMQSIILCLSAVRQIISNGLSILGISPMQKM